ncbi:S-methyl-5-thioribose-1-phosphate isomerase [candidate division KSB1 bacterium]|nr:S-methyl-5-thioribose-1-phosphate isomerase [candidate division KSB1 bacterium]NIR70066.1 S-methyl-5-thioribose-1-phosphate isomerase [candidate division KSB1 bacterium]NIS27504.1 S-methyl-5-thioribose-1-phosphate isomerase [candidate division KSB1 bacterium]NIT74353.1 S-methyl-5-thioribose-1-phosphate isomerase [candidate division KSB1 bacterium]NIU28222.1 S-methyl-5-thioribose-1-phosphate isomerase [candidate division KSB1 bacterium]
MPVTTIEWLNGKVRMIDQTKLPEELVYLDIEDVEVLAEGIKSLRVRGAPAIGIAGAFGLVLGIQNFEGNDKEAFLRELNRIADYLNATRPTAVNLSWALNRMKKVAQENATLGVEKIKERLLQEALKIWEEDREICRRIGKHGAKLIKNGSHVLTHCNTGALATADYGTALGVVFAANEEGKKVNVYADETRPLLQGARLNVWELMNEGIDVTLITDNTAAFVMQQEKVDCVIVGADRIAANGDTANKIGTYSVAVLAEKHGIPFYVAAPYSTIDFNIKKGADIPIEERAAEEVTEGFGKRTAPQNAKVYSPAFDITPHELISAIITEEGVIEPPFEINLKKSARNQNS